MMRYGIAGGVAALLLCGISAPATATLVLDQEHIASGDNLTGASSPDTNIRVAQTVTAGMTGTLSQVHIQMFFSDFLGFQLANAFDAQAIGINILDTETGVPLLAQDAILGSGSYVGLDGIWAVFNTSVSITEGQVFAIEPITLQQTFSWRWGGQYGEGALFTQNGAVFTTSVNGDAGFRTFIDNSPVTGGVVPEPASWAMLIAGFGLVGAAARRRRRMLAQVS